MSNITYKRVRATHTNSSYTDVYSDGTYIGYIINTRRYSSKPSWCFSVDQHLFFNSPIEEPSYYATSKQKLLPIIENLVEKKINATTL